MIIIQVEKLVMIDASVYAEGTGDLASLPRAAAYAGVNVILNYFTISFIISVSVMSQSSLLL